MSRAPQPEWLHGISYGLAGNRNLRVLIDGTRFAVVQAPGGMWYDNSGGHYGATSFYLVDKQRQYRKAHGLLDCRVLQHGGRAKTAQWKLLVETCDNTGAEPTHRQ